MPINVNNPEADALTRRFAHMAGVSITDAIVIAMKEAIERRRVAESPLQTAARLREAWCGAAQSGEDAASARGF